MGRLHLTPSSFNAYLRESDEKFLPRYLSSPAAKAGAYFETNRLCLRLESSFLGPDSQDLNQEEVKNTPRGRHDSGAITK